MKRSDAARLRKMAKRWRKEDSTITVRGTRLQLACDLEAFVDERTKPALKTAREKSECREVCLVWAVASALWVAAMLYWGLVVSDALYGVSPLVLSARNGPVSPRDGID